MGCTGRFHTVCVYQYSQYWTTISLQVEEWSICRGCGHAALYYVGMSGAHALGLYRKIAYYMRVLYYVGMSGAHASGLCLKIAYYMRV